MFGLHFLKSISFFRPVSKHLYRYSSNISNNFYVEPLTKRTVLRLSGKDTKSYIQSMMTNDIENFEKLPVLYSLLLNSQGRVLYDTILYKLSENEYLVEYDASGIEYLERHLIMYRLRKDVKIKPITEFTAWVVYQNIDDQKLISFSDQVIAQTKKIDGIVASVEDPRHKALGVRIITEKSIDLMKSLLVNTNFVKGDSYRLLRYKLGIGEGVLDHPPGECYPLDTNVDLLNGVSFTKGCYLGQELTAKSRYVFVMRKRMMPIVFQSLESYPMFPPECPIINEKSKTLGRLRSHLGQHGLALLKYEECEKSNLLKLKGFDVSLNAIRPNWWPSDLKSE